MQVVLVMFRSDGERRSFSVVRNMTVIGRREDCDLRIPVGDVSRKHCRLVRTDEGVRIEDLGSSNGTIVNGTRIQESDLNAGDVVGIGPVQFIVQIDGVPDESELAAPAQAANSDDSSMMGQAYAAAPAAAVAESYDELADEPSDEPAMELDELPLEEPALDEVTPEPTPEAADELSLSDDEFQLEEEPAAEAPAEEIALDELSADEVSTDELELEELPLEPVASHPLSGNEPTIDEDAPEASLSASDSADSMDDFGLEELPLAELPLAESPAAEIAPEGHADAGLEPVAFSPATPTPPAIPAAASSTPEGIEAVDLEDETTTHDGVEPVDLDAAGESEWDFVVEESEVEPIDDDFKIELDSPHEQPHGKAKNQA